MLFKWNTEYEKYMENKFPKNTGIYDNLAKPQVEALQDYFKWRTKEMFNQLYDGSKLRISPSKAKALVDITGGADDWMFDGIVDLGSMVGRCTLGHKLRYEYHAYSPSVRKEIIFGSTCASDFFEIAPEMLKRIDGIRKDVFEEIRKVLFIHYTNKTAEFKSLNYPDFPSPLLNNKETNDRFCMILGSGADVLHRILANQLPIPEYFVSLVTRFKKIEGRNKYLFTLIGDLDAELKNYIMTCMNAPDTFKPYKYIHERLGTSISNGVFGGNTSKDTIKNIATTGLRLAKSKKLIKDNLTDFNSEEYKSYSTVYYVNTNGNLLAAYRNQIDANVKGLTRKYACMLPDQLWEDLSAVLWACKGSEARLKNAFREARAHNYKQNEMYAFEKLLPNINRMLDKADTINIRNEIDKYKVEIDRVKQINNTVKEDLNMAVQLDEELDRAWNYLLNNKSKIAYDGIKDILNRYKDYTRLSEKQRNFVISVYKKMAEDVVPSVTQEARILLDNKENRRMLIHTDGNMKRCAFIVSNDACRPSTAGKFMITDVASVVEIVDKLEIGSEIIYVDSNSRSLLGDLLAEYSATMEVNVADKKYKIIDLSSVIGNKGVDDIKHTLGFNDSDMKRYTKSVFKEEGILDKFLEDTTAIFLEYRKIVRQNNKVG